MPPPLDPTRFPESRPDNRPVPEPAPLATPDAGARYSRLALHAAGGMATVWRAWDAQLGREVALKVLRPTRSAAARQRFLEEVRLVASMDHPAIVPVHDAGFLADGRPFFTMKLVQGRTFAAMLRGGGEGLLRRGAEVLLRVGQAVSWAHGWRGGVLHRDLKPANVLLGAHGEVYVLDWGIAVLRGSGRGDRAGTPAYMAPETPARRRPDERVDVYALGAMLGELLGVVDVSVPPELATLAAQATIVAPAARLPTAAAFVERLQAWIDGTERRGRALELVRAADALAPRIEALTDEAAAHEAVAVSLLEALAPWAPPRAKQPAWAREEAARAARAAADRLRREREDALQAALRVEPDLPEAHDRLAALYQARHAEAERANDTEAPTWAAAVSRHDRAGRFASWLAGDAWLSIDTAPSGAEVLLFRVEPHGRRRIARFTARLGVTPLTDVRLAHGDVVLLIRAPGCAPARLPLRLGRGERWSLHRPRDPAPMPLPLLPADSVGPDERYVPAGWFEAGGDDDAPDALPRTRRWIDGFVMQRFPVTVATWFAYLNALVQEGRIEEAEARAPTVRFEGVPRACWRWHERRIVPDFAHTFAPLAPDAPATNIAHVDVVAYATWRAARTGLPWRLPHELEWEKAARGADGRTWPWGAGFDPSFCSMVASHEAAPERVPVRSFPFDRSVYGVRGLAGNVRDWCANAYARRGPPGPLLDPSEVGGDARYRAVRGGAWLASASHTRAAARFASVPAERTGAFGFRLVRGV